MLSGRTVILNDLLALFFPCGAPPDTAAAQTAIREYIACGRKISHAADDEPPKPPIYSYSADAESITAAFLQVYGIDLHSVEMHWWRFRALLQGLLQHSFSERVKYRTANTAEIKDTKMRANWQRLARLYALDQRGEAVKEPQTLEELNEMLLAQARGER